MTQTYFAPLALALLLGVTVAPARAQVAASQTSAAAPLADDAVIFLATLHQLHEREPDFTYDDLRVILDAARPDVLIVETRPDELAGRTNTPGRPEYPSVVWPWLEGREITVIAMEPGGAQFEAITGMATQNYERFEREHPDGWTRASAISDALTTALTAHWAHPADAQDEVTRRVVDAGVLAEQALGGPGRDAVQSQWDGYMIGKARTVIAAHPGRRILIVGSYRNLGIFLDALADDPRLVDCQGWLRFVAFPR